MTGRLKERVQKLEEAILPRRNAKVLKIMIDSPEEGGKIVAGSEEEGIVIIASEEAWEAI